MSSDLEALARLLRVAPESQTADDADEEGRRLEAFAMGLATGKATAGDDRASTETFCALVQGRLLSRAYRLPPGAPGAANPGSVLRVVQCVRLMLRHGPFVARLGEIAGAAEALGDKFRAYADLHRAHSDASLADLAEGVHDEASKDAETPSARAFAFREEILRELASVFKKIATTPVDRAAKVSSRSRSDETVVSVSLSRDAHVVAVSLLSTRDVSLLASALVILRAATSRAFGESRATDVARSDCFYFLVAALREYDAPFDRLATDVLRNLLRLEEGRDGARAAGAVRVALELIRAEAENEGAEASARDDRGGAKRERDANARVKEEKRALALRVLCALLHDRAAVAEARAAGAPTVVTDTLRRLRESAGTADETATACLCCSALTKLAADDDGGEAVARADGVYALGRVLVGAFERRASHAEASSSDASAGARDITETDEIKTSRSAAAREETCAHAFRALRFVFSCDRERVRVAFKTLFPPDLFAAFIDVGQYKPELDRYAGIASRWLRLSETSAARFADALEEVGKRASGRGGGADGDGFFFDDWRARLFFARDTAGERPANAPRVVRGYALVECLGEGAFGKVHRAHKTSARGVGAARAVKEMFPKDERARSFSEPHPEKEASHSSVCRESGFADAVASEVRILSRLHHPNIVRYVESFTDKGSVFIVMELAEGASLAERIAGFRSADTSAPEPFLWDVFTQVLLALRYVHDEAGVVHRDITPNNILVDRDARRVKLVDFGLATALDEKPLSSGGTVNEGDEKKRAEASGGGAAAVGTMPYSCPEMIKQEPYDHKADVWSFGCVMYHVAALKPPFGGSNPLTVASQIVEGRFERLETATPPGLYSRALLDAVGAMLVVDPAARPSAEAAAAMRCGVVMREADRAREECDRAREELRRERLDREFEASMERRRRDAAAAFERRGGGARDVSADEAGFSFSGGRVRDAFSLRRTTSVPAGRASFVATADGGNRVKIAPERLRAVHDPATEMLAVMHKLAFVDRLPPSATRDARRAVAHRFVEFFFSGARSAGAVKAEAVKLMQGSPEPTPHGRGAGKEETYEDVARALEELLLEHGYYAATRAESR